MKTAIPLLLTCAILPAAAAQPVTLLEQPRHLRAGPEPEWAEFSQLEPMSDRLEIVFDSSPNPTEFSLSIRQDDVKDGWNVFLNGRRLGGLVSMDAPLEHTLPIPPNALAQGRNVFEVRPPARGIDDIFAGPIVLYPQPASERLKTATLEVSLVDSQSGELIPGRITLLNSEGALTALQPLDSDGNPFLSNQQNPVPLAARPGVVYTGSGRAWIGLAAGTYSAVAGRGFEWGIARARFTAVPGSHLKLELKLEREVATPGWVASDTHTHTFTHSRHGDASTHERVITLAGEGIELPIATDHNLVIDYLAPAKAMGVDSHFTPIPGNEVTTSKGHFNIFPSSPGAPLPDHRLTNWFELADAIRGTPAVQFVILNHPRDLHAGYRPFGPETFNPLTGRNTQGDPFFFDAIELMNSSAQQHDLMQVIHDWFALLNRGHKLFGVGSSDGHDVSRYIVGQGRTYVLAPDTDAGNIPIPAAIDSFRNGRLLVSMGLLPFIQVDKRFGPGDLVRAGDKLQVEVTITGPSWARAESVQLFLNGALIREKTLALADQSRPGAKTVCRWEIPRPRNDAHLVAITTGPGVREPFWAIPRPYQRNSPHFTPRVAGATNPVWIDADGDGAFTPPRERAQRIVNAVPSDLRQLLAALAPFDLAVAIQAAELCAEAGIPSDSPDAQALLATAPAHVRDGFDRYRTSLP